MHQPNAQYESLCAFTETDQKPKRSVSLLEDANNSEKSCYEMNSKANLLYLIAEYSLLMEIAASDRFFAGSWLIRSCWNECLGTSAFQDE
jgi:hypothetical protein